ncbi:MAG: hypothetical protein WC390_10370 [Sulfurimonas sp.]|jgi:hypothetical protein
MAEKPLHPKVIDLKIPRLKVGRRLKGPESFGCINSGVRPAMSHRFDGYYVGPELYIQDLVLARLGCLSPKQITRFKTGSRHDVRFFRTRNSAVKYFRQLISDMLYMNDSMQEYYDKAKQDAESDDYERHCRGVLNLADF